VLEEPWARPAQVAVKSATSAGRRDTLPATVLRVVEAMVAAVMVVVLVVVLVATALVVPVVASAGVLARPPATPAVDLVT
jgi:hypothetical protein